MFDKLVDVLLQFLDLFRFWVVMNEYEIGIMLRLGKFIKYLEGGRLYWKFPFNIDVEKTTNKSVDTVLFFPKTNTLSDGKTNITYALGASYNVVDAKAFYIEAEDAESSLIDSVLMEAAGIISEYSPEEILNGKTRSEIERRIRDAGRTQCRKYGIYLNRVKFAEFVLNHRIFRLIGQAT